MDNGDFDPKEIQNRLRAATKFAVGGLAGILLSFLLPRGLIIVLLSLPFAIVGGWQAFWNGTTLLSIRLEGAKRRYFQLAISLLTPAIASLWFFKEVDQFTISGLLADAMTWWILPIVAFIGWAGWAAGDLLHKQHPFRGFLAVTAAIFIVMFLGHTGMSYDPNCDDERDSCRYLNKEQAQRNRNTGQKGGLFLIYISVAYGAMYLHMWKKKRPLLF